MSTADVPPTREELENLRQRLMESQDRLARARREKTLLSRISSTIELPELLALLGEELLRIGGMDGYLINLIDEPRDNLCCEAIRLPAGFGEVEHTYLHLHFPLRQADPNVEAYRRKRPVLVDADSVQRYAGPTRSRFQRWAMKELVVLPIVSGRQALGTVMLFHGSQRLDTARFEAWQALLSLFRDPLRNAIHHRNLSQKEHALNAALAAQKQFLRFIAQVNSLTSTDTIYDMISREFLGRFPFDLVGLLTQDGDGLALRKLSCAKPSHEPVRAALEGYFQGLRYELDPADGASPLVFLQGGHLYFPDCQRIMDLPMSAKDRGSLQTMGSARSVAIFPIRRNEEPTGVLWLVSLEAPVEISGEDVEFIDLLCAFIGTAMANAELYTTVGQQKQEIEQLNESLQEKVVELRQLASRDRLTGLANFGAFEAEIGRRMAEYQRDSVHQGLSLVLLDVDHFKHFNDSHGHLAGNQALQEVARRLDRAARSMDVPCRYGGEEFVVILPKCDLDGARIFAERIRRAIEAEPVQLGETAVPITVSVGCACYHRGETMADLVERADRALYQAKQNGRNRVEVLD